MMQKKKEKKDKNKNKNKRVENAKSTMTNINRLVGCRLKKRTNVLKEINL